MKEQELAAYFEKNIKEYLSSLGISAIKRDVKINEGRADLLVKTKDNDNILIEVKSSGEPSYIFKAVSQLKYYQQKQISYLMVAVPKITERGKEICKSADVGYIDMQGQIFLKYKDKLIDKTADRQIPKEFIRQKKRVKKIFSMDSLRFLIFMLNNPNEWFTQEELSIRTGLSKSYINRILKTLESGIKAESNVLLFEGPVNKEKISRKLPGIVAIGEMEWKEITSKKKARISTVRKVKQYRISNPSKLLDVLSSQYDFKKNKIISLYSFERDPYNLIRRIEKVSSKSKLDYALTMHAGASQIAPYVRFQDVYFYARDKDIPKWVKGLDLRESELGGNVFLIVPDDEWVLEQAQKTNKFKIANNVQLYIDLINHPKRGKEQAEFLRKKKMGF